MVTTSNRVPTALYSNGLHQEAFAPFVRELGEGCRHGSLHASEGESLNRSPCGLVVPGRRCVVHDLDSSVDYRMMHELSSALYFHKHNTKDNTATAELDAAFHRVLSGSKPSAMTVELNGRHLQVGFGFNLMQLSAIAGILRTRRSKCCTLRVQRTVCRTESIRCNNAQATGCTSNVYWVGVTHCVHIVGGAMGAEEFLTLGSSFQTLLLDDIPQMQYVVYDGVPRMEEGPVNQVQHVLQCR